MADDNQRHEQLEDREDPIRLGSPCIVLHEGRMLPACVTDVRIRSAQDQENGFYYRSASYNTSGFRPFREHGTYLIFTGQSAGDLTLRTDIPPSNFYEALEREVEEGNRICEEQERIELLPTTQTLSADPNAAELASELTARGQHTHPSQRAGGGCD